MKLKTDPNSFLIDADNLSKNINIRTVFYLSLVILAGTILTISSINFSVNMKFEGVILPVESHHDKGDIYDEYLTETMIEIQVNEIVSNIFEKRQPVEIEIRDGEIIIYKNQGEIIQYLVGKNINQTGDMEAIIAREIQDGQIVFFPELLRHNLNTIVNVKDLRIKLPDLLNLMTNYEFRIMKINFFTNNEKGRIQTA